MKKIYLIVLLFLIVTFLTLLYLVFKPNKSPPEIVESDNEILFEKSETWGPCPPNTICKQSIKLYYSGDLILEGNNNLTIKLEETKIEEIINKIESTNVMNQDCTSASTLDYWATYKLYMKYQTKEITYPGCKDELKQIEYLIPLVKTN